MESKFKVGDRVLSLVYGIGIIETIKNGDRHPIIVDYENAKDEYTLNGKSLETHTYPEIYKDGDIHPLLGVPVRIPKQRVKKEIIKYTNIHKGGFSIPLDDNYCADGIYSSEGGCRKEQATYRFI
jgi:hypothetical protein